MKIIKDKIYHIEQFSFFISPLIFIITLAIVKLIVSHEILLISKGATPHFMMLCILSLASTAVVAALFSIFQIILLIFKKQLKYVVLRIMFVLLIPIEYYFLEVYKDSIRGAFETGREELIPIIISLLLIVIFYRVIFYFEYNQLNKSDNAGVLIDKLHEN